MLCSTCNDEFPSLSPSHLPSPQLSVVPGMQLLEYGMLQMVPVLMCYKDTLVQSDGEQLGYIYVRLYVTCMHTKNESRSSLTFPCKLLYSWSRTHYRSSLKTSHTNPQFYRKLNTLWLTILLCSFRAYCNIIGSILFPTSKPGIFFKKWRFWIENKNLPYMYFARIYMYVYMSHVCIPKTRIQNTCTVQYIHVHCTLCMYMYMLLRWRCTFTLFWFIFSLSSSLYPPSLPLPPSLLPSHLLLLSLLSLLSLSPSPILFLSLSPPLSPSVSSLMVNM